MYRYLVALLQQQGIYNTVKITHIYTTMRVAALQSGGIAAYAAPAGRADRRPAAAGFPILDKASADHRDLLGTSVTVITAECAQGAPGAAGGLEHGPSDRDQRTSISISPSTTRFAADGD